MNTYEINMNMRIYPALSFFTKKKVLGLSFIKLTLFAKKI